MKLSRSPIQARSNYSLHHRWVVAEVLLLFLAVQETTAAGSKVVLSASRECDPRTAAQARMASSSSTSSCGPESHCVWNGSSSLGGYCIDNDHKPADMVMPDALQELCNICEVPEGFHVYEDDQFDPDDFRVVTEPHRAVGHYYCGELDSLGKQGKLPKDSCHMFQQMIYADELCGCTSIDSKNNNAPLSYVGTHDGVDAEDTLAAEPTRSTNGPDSMYYTASGSSLQTIAITLGGAMIPAATTLMAFA